MTDGIVLVVDDEPSIRRFLATALRNEGYKAHEAADGAQALESVKILGPDLMILDLMMPGLDGMDVCRSISEESDTPIIILSAIGSRMSKVQCLRMGADDYMEKPVDVDELLARVDAVLRRSRNTGRGKGNTVFDCGHLEIRFAERRVTISEREIHMTHHEFALLENMAHDFDKVLTHNSLLKRIWGPEYGDEAEYLRVFIGRLRAKIGDAADHPTHIETEWGVGYRLTCKGKLN